MTGWEEIKKRNIITKDKNNLTKILNSILGNFTLLTIDMYRYVKDNPGFYNIYANLAFKTFFYSIR